MINKYIVKRKIGRFLNRIIGGHISIGKLTIFGDNAMHFGVTFSTKKFGYICFRLPLFCGIVDFFSYGGKLIWVPLYFYISPNATPWASTFMIGKKHDRRDWALARVRKMRFGHNFDTDMYREQLYKINQML
ncbi:MAG: hypothetical protein K0S61_99 [Anaerocolumna sp.]|jgi:hypothetical protein|nr:hypothetical protein [Anaerocolumna sp.]